MADNADNTNTLLRRLLEGQKTANDNFETLVTRVRSLEERMSGEKMPQTEIRKPLPAPVSVLPRQQEISTPVADHRARFAAVETPASDLDLFGPTGLPKTPKDPQAKPAKEDDYRNERPERRHSIHQHALLEAERNSSHVVTYGMREPYDHIRLNSRSPRAFFDFFEQIVRYERRTRSRLEAPTLLSDEMRDAVVALDPVKYGNLKFYDLTHDELYSALQSIFRPRSRLSFYKLMNQNVEFVFSGHFRPTPEYFEPFYSSLLAYKQMFIKYYDILALNNSEQNIPLLTFKDWGLLKLFISKIPFEYGSRTLVVLPATNWNSLHLFLRDFYGQVDNDKLSAEEARKLRESFGGTQYEAKKHEVVPKPRVDAPRPHATPSFKQLQSIEEFREETGAEELDEALLDAWFEDQLRDAETIEFDQSLQAMQYPQTQKPAPAAFKPSESKDPYVCILKVLYGACNKPGCKYDHREDPVHKTRIKYQDLLQKQLAQNKPSGAQRFPQRSSNMDVVVEEDQEY